MTAAGAPRGACIVLGPANLPRSRTLSGRSPEWPKSEAEYERHRHVIGIRPIVIGPRVVMRPVVWPVAVAMVPVVAARTKIGRAGCAASLRLDLRGSRGRRIDRYRAGQRDCDDR